MQIPVTELKKKKDSLLAAFRQNHKKAVKSFKSGKAHKPLWIFYDALAFIRNVYNCKSFITEDTVDVSKTHLMIDTFVSIHLFVTFETFSTAVLSGDRTS